MLILSEIFVQRRENRCFCLNLRENRFLVITQLVALLLLNSSNPNVVTVPTQEERKIHLVFRTGGRRLSFGVLWKIELYVLVDVVLLTC